jgi:PAS domain S-box-containing protein
LNRSPVRGAARLAAILDALPDALLLVDTSSTVVNANTAALELFEGESAQRLLGTPLSELLPSFGRSVAAFGPARAELTAGPPADDPGSLADTDADAEAHPVSRSRPERQAAARTDGTVFPAEVSSAALPGDEGELVLLIVRDLTGVLDVEAELRRQQRQIELILRAASEGIVGVDHEGRIVLVNPAGARILRYRASDLGAQNAHELIAHSTADGTPTTPEQCSLFDSLRSGTKHHSSDEVLWRSDGTAVFVDMTTAPVYEGENIIGAVMTFTDNSAALAAARQSRELAQLLEQQLQAPLSAALSQLKETTEYGIGEIGPGVRQSLLSISADLAQANTVVEDLVDYQHLVIGETSCELRTVSLADVIDAAVAAAGELADAMGVDIVAHTPEIDVSLDPALFGKLLAHLLSDMVGATPIGGKILLTSAHREAVLRIELRGPHTGGNATHLSIARAIAGRHGGTVTTHRIAGKGNTHVVELPWETVKPGNGPVLAIEMPVRQTKPVALPAPNPLGSNLPFMPSFATNTNAGANANASSTSSTSNGSAPANATSTNGATTPSSRSSYASNLFSTGANASKITSAPNPVPVPAAADPTPPPMPTPVAPVAPAPPAASPVPTSLPPLPPPPRPAFGMAPPPIFRPDPALVPAQPNGHAFDHADEDEDGQSGAAWSPAAPERPVPARTTVANGRGSAALPAQSRSQLARSMGIDPEDLRPSKPLPTSDVWSRPGQPEPARASVETMEPPRGRRRFAAEEEPVQPAQPPAPEPAPAVAPNQAFASTYMPTSASEPDEDEDERPNPYRIAPEPVQAPVPAAPPPAPEPPAPPAPPITEPSFARPRLLLWPEPDETTTELLDEYGHSATSLPTPEDLPSALNLPRPAAVFVDPIAAPITRRGLRSLHGAAVAAGLPLVVTAGIGGAPLGTAPGPDPALLLQALTPAAAALPRVMLVEERPDLAAALTRSLERQGMQVLQAATDSESVAAAVRGAPDVVVMDLMQIRRRRVGIVEWLRDQRRLALTPIVVYTCLATDPGDLAALRSGAWSLYLAERAVDSSAGARIADLLSKIAAV